MHAFLDWFRVKVLATVEHQPQGPLDGPIAAEAEVRSGIITESCFESAVLALLLSFIAFTLRASILLTKGRAVDMAPRRSSSATAAEISLVHLKNCMANLPQSLSSSLLNLNTVCILQHHRHFTDRSSQSKMS